MSTAPARDGGFEVDVVAFPPAWRVAAAVLRIVARGSLLVTLGLFLFSDSPPNNPFRQMRLFGYFFLAPELAAWFLARAFAARLRVTGGALVLEQRQQTSEVPVSAITALEPWALPAPRPGLWLRLRSGRRFSLGLATDDPAGLCDALVREGASADLRRGVDRPIVRYANARRVVPPNWLENPLVKFVVYSLVPTIPAHRLHQFITYGGWLGEYYTFGLKDWLLGFALWWVSWGLGMLVLAAGIRALLVEPLALAAAAAAPGWAVPVRRGLEVAQRLIYYVGIPAWIILRFTA